jgi:hypothetical protein
MLGDGGEERRRRRWAIRLDGGWNEPKLPLCRNLHRYFVVR